MIRVLREKRVTQADGDIAWSSPVWFVYEGIAPVVVADAGGPEPHYIMPNFRIPLPVLIRNQKDVSVKGQMRLKGAPTTWTLDPPGAIEFDLPPDNGRAMGSVSRDIMALHLHAGIGGS